MPKHFDNSNTKERPSNKVESHEKQQKRHVADASHDYEQSLFSLRPVDSNNSSNDSNDANVDNINAVNTGASEEKQTSATEEYLSGSDESGLGAFAGPLACATVCITRDVKRIGMVRDSKKLSPRQRAAVFTHLTNGSIVGLEYNVVLRDPKQIDSLKVHRANMDALRQSITSLRHKPTHVLIDGNRKPPGIDAPEYTVHCIVGGDQRCWVIAAASIIAKVTRDRVMEGIGKLPQYIMFKFEQNKGYGTKDHKAALQEYPPSDLHRLSFWPVRASRDLHIAKVKSI